VIIIFSGSIGRFPIGGHAWAQMQYLAGLRELGHEVYYLEECGEESWVYNWQTEQVTHELDYPAGYIRECLTPLGLDGRWIYRAGQRSAGMTSADFLDVCAHADLLIVRAVPLAVWREEYMRPKRRIFIDVDPGFIQIDLVNGHAQLTATADRCEHLFTIGQRIGSADCSVPLAGRKWMKTLSPIALSLWPFAANGHATHFTTVMQWRGFREATFKGVLYGQKNKEFPKFIDLPRHTEQKFQMALTGASPENLTAHGWEVVPGWVASQTTQSYQQFIQDSRAEFSVAKHGYVLMRGGWFSDRSVCYLASGRPVLVEDTGLDDWLPLGKGIVTFKEISDAAEGIESINADYEGHRYAARKIAEEIFATERVLPPLLETAMH
jgi:hypothetical protein